MLRKPAPIAQPVHAASNSSTQQPSLVSSLPTRSPTHHSNAADMQRGSHPQPIGGASEDPATSAPAPIAETDYQRILRETAAARAHRTQQQDKGSAASSSSSSSHHNALRQDEQKSSEPAEPPSFAQLRQQLSQQQPHSFAAPPARANAMPVASAPALSPTRSAVAARVNASDAAARAALEVPSRYNADELLARRLQAEEEARSRAEQVISPAERTRRQLAAEADARMARELQAAEVAQSQRGHRAEAARRTDSDADAELARTLQAEESQGRSGVDSPGSQRSRHSRGTSRDDDDDGVILLPSDIADAEEQNRRDLDEVHRRHQEAHRRDQLQSSADQLASGGSAAHPPRSREQIIRRLHELQGAYPGGIGGRQQATFRFRPDGRLVVGWNDDDDGAGGEAGSSSRPASSANEVNLGADEEAAQRAAFAQFEREQAARQARQGGAAAPAAAAAGGDDGSGSGGVGFWGALGGMLHRHLRNANQGIPFPLSIMVEAGDPSDVQGFGRRPELSGPGFRGWQWSRSFGDGDGDGHRARQAELDVDSMDYDQLLRLEDALGSVKPKNKPATREQLDQLPVQAFHKPAAAATAAAPAAASSSSSSAAAPSAAAAAAAAEGSECSICCCEFEEGDAVKTLPCFHRFHAAEIDRWLSTNELCPICRVPVGGRASNS